MVQERSDRVRVVKGFSKIPDEDGDQRLIVRYKLQGVDVDFLKTIFTPDFDDPSMGLGYEINEEQAKALQPYVVDGVIDLEEYDFVVACYQAPVTSWGKIPRE